MRTDWRDRIPTRIHFGMLLFVSYALLSACSPLEAAAGWLATSTPTLTPSSTSTPSPTSTNTFTPTYTFTPTRTLTPSLTPTPSRTPTITLTPTASFTPSRTPTITPTPEIRGRVQVQSNCRYGPGSAYLYEWGLYPGNRVTVLNRNEEGTWVYVDPWNYVGYCWVKADLLEIDGNHMMLEPYYGILPASDLYGPVSNVRASRVEKEVWIAWDPIWMTEDDYRGYLIETWVCQSGKLVFRPFHADYPLVIVEDEPGCTEDSFGRVYAAEKHGYTRWVAIPWPHHPSLHGTPEEDF